MRRRKRKRRHRIETHRKVEGHWTETWLGGDSEMSYLW